MKKIVSSAIAFLFVFAISISGYATEGMWLPQLLQALNEKDMKKQGMKIGASDIYNINNGSLKDAIVSLGGFCTAEVISNSGLILTNHHCGFDAIQNHSTLEHNYIRDGFWSKNNSEELTNKGLTATFIIRIIDVTDSILQNTIGLSESARQSTIDKNIAACAKTVAKETFQDVLIRPFFEGNKYFLFVTETYKDVRLVGAPPSSIGNFGKDTDNWMWPRHTGDFSLFRIYADKNNHPAPYAADNVPYKPKKSLNISLDGVSENDFTMVMGFPGRTTEYLHSAAVAQIMNVTNPAKIAIRAKILSTMKEYMVQNEQIKIQYAAKYASVENAYKKWQGEILGLKSKNGIGKKKLYEATFQKRVQANPDWSGKYGTLLSDLETAYSNIEPLALARDIHNETLSRLELIAIGSQLNSLIGALDKNGLTGYNNTKSKVTDVLSDLYKEYNVKVDKALFTSLLSLYMKTMKQENIAPALLSLVAKNNNDMSAAANELYSKSALTDSSVVFSWLGLPAQEAINMIKNDDAVRLVQDFQKMFAEKINAAIPMLQSNINILQRNYMQAQIEVFKEKSFYPDANSTLRVTYGNAKGYTPRDGVQYAMYTYLDGVMEKYVPGDYEFDVAQKLQDLYNTKDYGAYGSAGRQPVCFIATNHTTGGNSGSPALDAYGNLIGLNFDRVWEGTMSDINYDPSICRNIMVDIRYVCFIIDKFAGAKNIISELKFVHPKKVPTRK